VGIAALAWVNFLGCLGWFAAAFAFGRLDWECIWFSSTDTWGCYGGAGGVQFTDGFGKGCV